MIQDLEKTALKMPGVFIKKIYKKIKKIYKKNKSFAQKTLVNFDDLHSKIYD